MTLIDVCLDYSLPHNRFVAVGKAEKSKVSFSSKLLIFLALCCLNELGYFFLSFVSLENCVNYFFERFVTKEHNVDNWGDVEETFKLTGDSLPRNYLYQKIQQQLERNNIWRSRMDVDVTAKYRLEKIQQAMFPKKQEPVQAISSIQQFMVEYDNCHPEDVQLINSL